MLALMLHLTFLDGSKTKKIAVSLLSSFYLGLRFNLFFDLKKCPECYGDELCRFFHNGQIQLTFLSSLLSLVDPNLTKSVFRGVFNGTEVILKRKTQRFASSGDKLENVVLCPGVRDVGFLLSNLTGELWLDLNASIEPLLLKYFESMPEWPVPRYLGACGDLIVEENKGQRLTSFVDSSFKTRAALAVELLKMAELFTFGHPDYAFYFTDYSLDNLVADSLGKVSLVDLDNVIISARPKGVHPPKGSIHRSEILDERNFAFSPSDICSHYVSDHNFFSVCKYLLSHPENGLLRVIPTNTRKHAQVSRLLSECTKPEALADRFSAGSLLQSLLSHVVETPPDVGN